MHESSYSEQSCISRYVYPVRISTWNPNSFVSRLACVSNPFTSSFRLSIATIHSILGWLVPHSSYLERAFRIVWVVIAPPRIEAKAAASSVCKTLGKGGLEVELRLNK